MGIISFWMDVVGTPTRKNASSDDEEMDSMMIEKSLSVDSTEMVSPLFR